MQNQTDVCVSVRPKFSASGLPDTDFWPTLVFTFLGFLAAGGTACSGIFYLAWPCNALITALTTEGLTTAPALKDGLRGRPGFRHGQSSV